MHLTASAYSFEVLPLEACLSIVKHMGFSHVDLSGFHARGRASVEPDAIVADTQGEADKMKALLDKYELIVSDFFPQFGLSFDEHSLNNPNPAIREKNYVYIRACAHFSQLIGSPGMTILPGVDHTVRPLAENLSVSIEYLRRAVEIAGAYGVEIRFEPHMGAVADTPELALQLVEAVPGLKVTLDVSHFTLQYIPVERVYALVPHTGHVHIRQARPGKLQVAYDEGSIDFPDLIARLKAVGYRGGLTVEYVCADWFEVNRNDTLYESAVALERLTPYVN